MEALIPAISKLQDVFATDGVGSIEQEVQLPQIVVVGSQSAGKSSVLEGIVGRDFLPRGTGIVTRRPLLLHLTRVPTGDSRRDVLPPGTPANADWAMFEHKPEQIFTDFEAVRREIEEETARVTGSNKGISPLPINLTIFSQLVVDLSLVDLPGITKLPVGDQPHDIEVQIRRLIEPYINNRNSLILAVTPANQDFATSEPLKVARQVDPHGDRTLAVLTKLDLMDAGTDAMEVLTGKLVPVKLGIIGVVNRSQADINGRKNIQACLKDEAHFLQQKYPSIASSNGIPFLSKTLNQLLMHHIHDCLPKLKMRIHTMMTQCEADLHKCGEPVTDKSRTLLQVISNFTSAYASSIDGTSKRIQTAEISGGARINHIFFRLFSKDLEAIDPMGDLSRVEILNAIQNSMGTRTHLFIPDITFELLVKRQILRLEEPSLCCVDLVHDELLHLVRCCGLEIEQDMKRFPVLFERIHQILASELSRRLAPAKQFVSGLISIQLAFVNSKHPEFSDAPLLSLESVANNRRSITDADNVTEVPEYADEEGTKKHSRSASSKMFGKSKARKPSSSYPPYSNHNALSSAEMSVSSAGSARTENGRTGNGIASTIYSLFQGHGRDVHPADQTIHLPMKKGGRPGERALSEREENDCRIIERLIRSYYTIVRKVIQDLVPKAIMHFLVNQIRDTLHNELVRQLYNAPDSDGLLRESDSMASERKKASKTLEALKKANSAISEVRETYIW